MTETDLERRLREALSARATTVTSRDLRPASAPSRTAGRSTVARWSLPIAAGLAAAAVSVTAFALLRPADPTPAPPAAPASPSSSPLPASPVPRPTATVAPEVTPSAATRTTSTAEPTPTRSTPARATLAPSPR
ncbi:hypothetical protein [Actinoplanes awajinensis]|uniref:Uncharacterized protein n=1 Tax=Actinoplanes awajinensis subsp. mycoplanecinus TaxID=135947 RepID=A0A0X3VDX5_9ACTN|nr:hypothetical protein [Actinoplanes awajinensis]KUL41506.1 hypothetical protein ADL15_04460 [Actinoplanes awajinensis subsp. mycoplanecinus]